MDSKIPELGRVHFSLAFLACYVSYYAFLKVKFENRFIGANRV